MLFLAGLSCQIVRSKSWELIHLSFPTQHLKGWWAIAGTPYMHFGFNWILLKLESVNTLQDSDDHTLDLFLSEAGAWNTFSDHTWMVAAQREVEKKKQRALLNGGSSRQRANTCPLGVLAAPPVPERSGGWRVTSAWVFEHVGLQPALGLDYSDVFLFLRSRYAHWKRSSQAKSAINNIQNDTYSSPQRLLYVGLIWGFWNLN